MCDEIDDSFLIQHVLTNSFMRHILGNLHEVAHEKTLQYYFTVVYAWYHMHSNLETASEACGDHTFYLIVSSVSLYPFLYWCVHFVTLEIIGTFSTTPAVHFVLNNYFKLSNFIITKFYFNYNEYIVMTFGGGKKLSILFSNNKL